MSIYKKHTRPFIQLLLIIAAVFLLHLIITPLSLTQSQSTATKVGSSGDVAKTQSPFHLFGESFIVTDFNGIEVLTDIGINYVINRNIRDFQRIINRVFLSLVVPLINLGIMIYYILHYYRKKLEQRKSVLAISIGGHAPPRMLLLR
jgi:hypothetical protein